MEEIINEYVIELGNTPEFKRLIELKNIIDNKYAKEILIFKTKEDKYNEALNYPNNYNIDEIKKELINAKSKLYSYEEVKEYFELENHIQNILKSDFDKIKNSISENHSLRCNRLK